MIVFKCVLEKGEGKLASVVQDTLYKRGVAKEFSGSYGALAFCSLEMAEDFVEENGGGFKESKIFIADAELMPLPPTALYLKDVKNVREEFEGRGDRYPYYLGTWPPGTVMCRKITLLKEAKEAGTLVYKVVRENGFSAFYDGGRFYEIGRTEVFEGSYGALAFISKEYATEWSTLGKATHPRFFLCEAELSPMPPMSNDVAKSVVDSLHSLWKDRSIASTGSLMLAKWPKGTVMCSSITPLKEVR
jgi:hypothetical protein